MIRKKRFPFVELMYSPHRIKRFIHSLQQNLNNMKSIKIWLLACTLAMMGSSAAAQPLNETEEFDEDTLTEESYQLMMEEMVNSLNYQTGKISLYNAATITVPSGYAFLNTKDAMFILSDLWGNPVDSTIVGMLVPTKYKMYEEKVTPLPFILKTLVT